MKMIVEIMMTTHHTHRNWMYVCFKTFLTKQTVLQKPDSYTNQDKRMELCNMSTSEAFVTRSKQNKRNRSELRMNHAFGSQSFQHTQACMKNLDIDNFNPAKLYKKNYIHKDGV